MGEGATADQGCSCTLTQFDHPQTRHNGAPEGAGAALAKRRVSLCPTVRRLQVQDLGSNPGPLSLAGRWLSPPRVLMWFSFCVSVSSFPLVRAAVTLDWVHPVTSLYFIHVVKGPSCSHVLRGAGGSRPQHRILEVGHSVGRIAAQKFNRPG